MDGRHTAVLTAAQTLHVFWHTLAVSKLTPTEDVRERLVSEPSELSALGIEPVTDDKLVRLRYERLVRFPQDCGRDPVNLLKLKST